MSKFNTPEMQEIESLEKRISECLTRLSDISYENHKLKEENDALNKMFELLDIKHLLKERGKKN